MPEGGGSSCKGRLSLAGLRKGAQALKPVGKHAGRASPHRQAGAGGQISIRSLPARVRGKVRLSRPQAPIAMQVKSLAKGASSQDFLPEPVKVSLLVLSPGGWIRVPPRLARVRAFASLWSDPTCGHFLAQVSEGSSASTSSMFLAGTWLLPQSSASVWHPGVTATLSWVLDSRGVGCRRGARASAGLPHFPGSATSVLVPSFQ